MKNKIILISCLQLWTLGFCNAQSAAVKKTNASIAKNNLQKDSTINKNTNTVLQKDLQDLFRKFFRPKAISNADIEIKDTKKHFSFIPAAGYTLQTGWAGIVSGNMAFYKDTAKDTKLSNVLTSIAYSQYKQTIFPFQASIWSKSNKYNFITDFRYINYPSSIYGLGRRVDPNIGHTITYTGIKLHQTVMRLLGNDLYLGAGFYFDRFYNIKALDSVTATVNQQLTRRLGSTETAAGIAIRFLYDNRLNQINPDNGSYINITYRTSAKVLGSDSTWKSLLIDARTYLPFPKNSGNVLAFWMMDWLTANGNPPYLLLPSTGWDDNYNTGRGYVQSRFRGRNMLYFESEYRFGISNNGLVGGVMFANLQSFSSDLSTQYTQLSPGYGLGLRLKLNKYSKTNLCIDYGFGKNGSHGFFVNLGEVF